MHPPLRLLFRRVANRVVDAADRVLDLAYDLVVFSFGRQFSVADDFAGSFLDGAFGLPGRTLDTIFVHVEGSCLSMRPRARQIDDIRSFSIRTLEINCKRGLGDGAKAPSGAPAHHEPLELSQRPNSTSTVDCNARFGKYSEPRLAAMLQMIPAGILCRPTAR